MSKVMLVEDDNNLREIYEARLQAEGYTIVTAHDGEEALVVAKAEQPDLIISDVMMPKISGFEMLDILRNTEGLKDVKVIMLTALGQSDDQQRADRLGADSYLVKSQVTLEDIVKVAGRLLGNEEVAPVAEAAVPDALPAVEATPAPVMPLVSEPAVEPVMTTSSAPEPTVVSVPEPVAVFEPVAIPEPVIAPVFSAPQQPAAVTVPEPITVQNDVPVAAPAEPIVPTTDEDFIKSLGASTEATLIPAAQPLAEEAATVEAQIAAFENTATATPTEVTPTEPLAKPPEINQTVPTLVPEEASFMATPAPDLTTISAPQPSLQSAGNDDVLANAMETLTGAPAPATTDSMPIASAQEATVDTTVRGGNRVITPLDAPDKPDINTLLAMEEAKEVAEAPLPTVPTGSTLAPQQPVSQAPVSPTSPPVAPTVTNPGFDHNSIAL